MRAFIWLMILCGVAGAQTAVDLKSQAKNIDFSSAQSTRPMKVGSTLPAVCTTGELFFKQDAVPGSNVYACVATNTWVVSSGSGGGGVVAGEGITIAAGSVAADDAVIPRYLVGSGIPVVPCVRGRDFYLDQSASDLYHCGPGGVWSALSRQNHTHTAAEVTEGLLPLARGGSNQGTWVAGRCVQVSADGTRLEAAAAACASGGGNVNIADRIWLPAGYRDAIGGANRVLWTTSSGATVALVGTVPDLWVGIGLPDNTDTSAVAMFKLPSLWNGEAINVRVYWIANTVATNSVSYEVSLGCSGLGQTLPPAYNAVSGNSFRSGGNGLVNEAEFDAVASGNCSAGSLASLKVTRDGDGTGGVDDLTASALFLGAEVRFTRSAN